MTTLFSAISVLSVVVSSHAQVDPGRLALRAGRYEEAIQRLGTAAERGDDEAARWLTRALEEVGRYDEAERRLRGYLAARPGRRVLWLALGEVLRLKGQVREASDAFTRGLAGQGADSLSAALALAELKEQQGDVAAARRAYRTFITAYNEAARLPAGDLLAVARAARHLGATNPQLFKDALRAYDEAAAADSLDLQPRVETGDLFLDKYNETEARATYQAVLKINPRHAGALLGLARAAHFEGSPEALDDARKSLEANPQYVPSLLFVAQLALEREAYEEADAQIARALGINPASPEGLSLRAATHWLEGDSSALRPGSAGADLYTTLAEALGRNRRYREALQFAGRAVALDSTSWRGFALLGINQLRLGQVAAARASLERAFAGDPYDVWTKNTLDLLDNLDRYRGTATRRFRFVAAPGEADLLALYAGPLAEEAFDSLARHYGYQPGTPIRVEMYDRHADFSVRTVGLVGLGALGVSFGPVVAMDAPSAREPGEFHWGSTLWHEVSHSFHLGLSDSRVPRWFTEGLAVFEERRARPGWGDGVTPGFLKAFLQGRLVPVSQLNRGFTDPDYPEQLIYSYYEASLVCDLVAAERGPGALTQLLRQFGQGRTTAQAFLSVLGVSPGDLDRRFDGYLRQRFAVPLQGLEGFDSLLTAGHALLAAGRPDSAERLLLRASRLFPEYAGPDGPGWLLAQIYLRRGARAAAAAELDTLTRGNAGYYQALLVLAGLRDSLGDKAAAARAYDGAMYVYPLDLPPHVRLAELAADLGWWSTAVRERRAVLALAPGDRAEALYQLALAYYGAGQREEARRSVVQALETAPGFERAQELLLKIREGK